jgi:hypothetical protein
MYSSTTDDYHNYSIDQKRRQFFSIWPRLVSTNFKRRSRSVSQTRTPSPNNLPLARLRVSLPCSWFLSVKTEDSQDAQTQIYVRRRDRRCLITGQAAVSRARGGNFTGLEVAHIFPLMAVDDVITTLSGRLFISLFPNVDRLDRTYASLCSKTSISSSERRSTS